MNGICTQHVPHTNPGSAHPVGLKLLLGANGAMRSGVDYKWYARSGVDYKWYTHPPSTLTKTGSAQRVWLKLFPNGNGAMV